MFLLTWFSLYLSNYVFVLVNIFKKNVSDNIYTIFKSFFSLNANVALCLNTQLFAN